MRLTGNVTLRHEGSAAASHTTEGESLFELAARALDWFESPHWLGVRPTLDAVLEIRLVRAPDHVIYVQVKRVREKFPAAALQQNALFDRAPDPYSKT